MSSTNALNSSKSAGSPSWEPTIAENNRIIAEEMPKRAAAAAIFNPLMSSIWRFDDPNMSAFIMRMVTSNRPAEEICSEAIQSDADNGFLGYKIALNQREFSLQEMVLEPMKKQAQKDYDQLVQSRLPNGNWNIRDMHSGARRMLVTRSEWSEILVAAGEEGNTQNAYLMCMLDRRYGQGDTLMLQVAEAATFIAGGGGAILKVARFATLLRPATIQRLLMASRVLTVASFAPAVPMTINNVADACFSRGPSSVYHMAGPTCVTSPQDLHTTEVKRLDMENCALNIAMSGLVLAPKLGSLMIRARTPVVLAEEAAVNARLAARVEARQIATAALRAEDETVDEIVVVARRRVPRSGRRMASRAEVEPTVDPARQAPAINARLGVSEEDLANELRNISDDVPGLTRQLDEVGLDDFIVANRAAITAESEAQLRLIYARILRERQALAALTPAPGVTPAPSAAPAPRPRLEQVIEEYQTRTITTPRENTAYIGMARAPRAAGGFFVDSQNRALKWLNDNLKDKGVVDALSNRHSAMVQEAMNDFARRYPRLRITTYSDYKGIRYGIRGPPGSEERYISELRDRMDEVDARFMDELREGNYVSAEARQRPWFSTGVARTADEANVQAKFPPGTSWENIEEVWTRIERLRAGFQTRFGNTGLMTAVPNSNKKVLSADVIEVIRKKPDSEEAARILNHRYGTALTAEDVNGMRIYYDEVNLFSPGLLIDRRVVHQYETATHGGMTIDFTGVGSLNGEATAIGLARGNSLSRSIAFVREAEQPVTTHLDVMKITSERVITDVLRRNGINTSVTVSGDDLVAVFDRPVTEAVRRQIVLAQAQSGVPSSMRVSFFREGIASPAHRSILATEGEGIEKILRGRLEFLLSPAESRSLIIATDMRGVTPGNGAVDLITNNALSPEKMAIVRREFALAVEQANSTYSSGFSVAVPLP